MNTQLFKELAFFASLMLLSLEMVMGDDRPTVPAPECLLGTSGVALLEEGLPELVSIVRQSEIPFFWAYFNTTCLKQLELQRQNSEAACIGSPRGSKGPRTFPENLRRALYAISPNDCEIEELGKIVAEPIDGEIKGKLSELQSRYPKVPLNLVNAFWKVKSTKILKRTGDEKGVYVAVEGILKRVHALIFPLEKRPLTGEDLKGRYRFVLEKDNLQRIIDVQPKELPNWEEVGKAFESEAIKLCVFRKVWELLKEREDFLKNSVGSVCFEMANKKGKVFLPKNVCFVGTEGLSAFRNRKLNGLDEVRKKVKAFVELEGFTEPVVKRFIDPVAVKSFTESIVKNFIEGIDAIENGCKDYRILEKALCSIANEPVPEGLIDLFGFKLNYLWFLSNLFCPRLEWMFKGGEEKVKALNERFLDQFVLVQDEIIKNSDFLERNPEVLREIVEVYFKNLEIILGKSTIASPEMKRLPEAADDDVSVVTKEADVKDVATMEATGDGVSDTGSGKRDEGDSELFESSAPAVSCQR